jgi:hypothetical protein
MNQSGAHHVSSVTEINQSGAYHVESVTEMNQSDANHVTEINQSDAHHVVAKGHGAQTDVGHSETGVAQKVELTSVDLVYF